MNTNEKQESAGQGDAPINATADTMETQSHKDAPASGIRGMKTWQIWFIVALAAAVIVLGAAFVFVINRTGEIEESDTQQKVSTPAAETAANGLIVHSCCPATLEQGDIYTQKLDGSGKKQLTHTTIGTNTHPSWSPDGTKIVFMSSRTGHQEIWVMDADGSNQKQLTHTDAMVINHLPSYSSDGNRIIFTSTRDRGGGFNQAWVMNADGSDQKLLFRTEYPLAAPSFSPDGKKVVFGMLKPDSASSGAGADIQVYTANTDGTDMRQLTTPRDAEFSDSTVPIYSPDGKKIAFWSGVEGMFGQIWVMDADGSNQKQLSTCPKATKTNCDEPAWSADGKFIIYGTNRNNGPAETWIMNADGSDEHKLLDHQYGLGRHPFQPVGTKPAAPTPASAKPVESTPATATTRYLTLPAAPTPVSTTPVESTPETAATRYLTLPAAPTPASATPVESTPATATTRYLTFQIFTGTPDPSIALGPPPLSPLPTKAVMAKAVQDIITKIGTTGDKSRKLGFTPGPLAFDYTDEELKRFIRESFEIAREKNVAVSFHIDDSMFWGKRTALLANNANKEWLDWNGTPNTGRRIDWAETPVKFAPQMCFNSPDIQKEVKRFAGVVGREIKKQADPLKADGREELFAGVIAGWETQIGRDLDTGKYLGYCALTNKGFSAKNPPKDIDLEREKIVREFIELWAKALIDAGIPQEKIYAHTAFASQQSFEQMKKNDPARFSMTYSQVNNFAPSSVSFSTYYQPGFSTYPQPGLLDQISEGLSQNNNPPWASSEGTAVVGVAMETYLAGLVNHGATMVNIFAWGVGPYVPQNPYRYATERPEAVAAYRKFLRGGTLKE